MKCYLPSNTKRNETSLTGPCSTANITGNTGKKKLNALSLLSSQPLIQFQLRVGAPNDKYEQQADRVAEQVMRLPETGIVNSKHSPPHIQRVCADCDEKLQAQAGQEKEQEEILQAKTTPGHAPALNAHTTTRIQSLQGAGRPLPESARGFFESRFGQDFSRVRIHTDARAAGLADTVRARACSGCPDVGFGAGAYSARGSEGKRLLAHELTHVIQQNGSASRIQRELLIGGPEDKKDPAARMSAAQRNNIIEKLIKQLGSGFKVKLVSGTGDITGKVVPDKADCSKPATIASSSKGVGSCCLCILTRAGSQRWIIRVVTERGAGVHFGTRRINIPASSSPAVSGHWTQTDVRQMRPRIVTFAHELCGHAALYEVKAHPKGSRVTGTRHDPTIRLERAIWAEQGLPLAQQRGLASSPVHRGESFTRIVVQNFRFGSPSLRHLPAKEFKKIVLAARLAFLVNPSPPPEYFNNRYVDIIGHADKPAKSATANQAISDKRANNVKRQMIKMGVTSDIEVTKEKRPFRDSRFHTKSGTVARYTEIRGVSASACQSSGKDPACRKVEIFLAGYPAGAAKPPTGTPSTLTPATPYRPAAKQQALKTGDACVKLLIGKAWTP